MDTDLATQLVAARTVATQGSIQTAIIKKNHDMEMSLISMLSEVALAPPPQGQGLKVDKTA